MLCLAILFQVFAVIVIGYTIKKINQEKVEILSIFLDTTEKNIQHFSDKTENFLITLHVEESAEAQGSLDEENQNKKNIGSSAMFTKKKRFKTSEFPKSTYASLLIFVFAFMGFYIHCFAYNYEKIIFLESSVEYINCSSIFQDVFSRGQASIEKVFHDSRFSELNKTALSEVSA